MSAQTIEGGQAATLPVPQAVREVLGAKLMFSFAESAWLLNRSLSWIHNQASTGRVRCVALGGRRAIPRAELVRLASEGSRPNGRDGDERTKP